MGRGLSISVGRAGGYQEKRRAKGTAEIDGANGGGMKDGN